MATNFDPNKYKKIFEQRYGSGSFESGLSSARNIGKLKAQASFAKKDYLTAFNKAKSEAKKLQEQQDFIDTYGTSKEDYNAQKKKAQAEQKRAQAQGRGGFEPDYAHSKAEEKKAKSAKIDYNKLTPYARQEMGLDPKWEDPKKKTSEKSKKKAPGLLDKLKKSEIGRAATAAEQFFNPFDKVTAKDAVNNYLHHKQSDTFKEVSRGANRAVDSASLGAMSNLDKKVNKRDPYYNTSRKMGDGGGTDMITSGLGYLVPGVGAGKAVKAVGLGAKEATGLAKIGQLGKQGAATGAAVTGAEVGIREALNPKDQNWKQNLGYVGIGTAAGAVADPLLHGLGNVASKQWGKLAKGEVPTFTGKPSQEALNKLVPKVSSGKNDSSKLYDSLITRQSQPLREVAATAEPRLKAGRDYEPITASQPVKEGGKLVRLKENPFEGPYNPSEPLPDTRTQIVNKTDKNLEPISKRMVNKVSQTYINNVDNVYRLKQFMDDAKFKSDKPIPEDKNAYTLALNSRGYDMVAHQILNQHMVDHQGNAVGLSLADVSKKIPKGKQIDFADYMINKHAITRMGRGEKVFKDDLNMNIAKSKAKIAEYETQHPEFKDAADEFMKFNQELANNWLVKTGVIPKDVWEGYVKANPDYVSNERYFSDLESYGKSNQAKRAFANQSNPIKKAPGSQRPIINPFETSIERVAKYTKIAKRNEVMQTLISHIQKDPEAFAGWAEIVPNEKNPGAFMDSLESMLQKEGVDKTLDELNKAFEQKPDLTHGNIVTGLVDGKPVHVRVNDAQLLEALTNLTPQAQEGVIKAVGKVTRMMKTLTTGVNPIFSLTRNIWRDVPQAYKNSKTVDNPITYTKDLASAIVDVFGNRESFKAFKAMGGGHASPVSSDINLLAKSKRQILGEKGLRTWPEKAMSGIEGLSNIMEAAPRLAEFKRIAKNGDYASRVKGLYEANDITVNFNRYGNNIKQLDAIIPYLNAAVQGLDKFARVYKDNPIKATAKGVMAITIPTAVSQAWNYFHDWEGYKALPAYVRDSNILFSIGDGKFVKIPKPREDGMFFGALPERLFLQFAEQDPRAFEGYAQSLLNNFIPPTRLITAPLDDIRANKDFSGRPIVPGDLATASPRFQYDENTSEVSKKIGDITNISPKQLDYLAKSYTGVLGQLGVPATAKGATIGETLEKQVTADSVYSNNAVDRFYTLKNKADTAARDYNLVGIKTKDYDEPLRKSLGQLARDMSNVRKQIKSVENNDSLSNYQKKLQERKLQEYINKLAEQGYKMKEGK